MDLFFPLNVYRFTALNASVMAARSLYLKRNVRSQGLLTKAETCSALMSATVSEHLLSQTFAALLGIVFWFRPF